MDGIYITKSQGGSMAGAVGGFMKPVQTREWDCTRVAQQS